VARLYPEWERISQLNPPPTAGERRLLRFLDSVLSNEYEVFFQPFLNGDQPDIVLMRKGGGVLVIEVKDWNLDSYYVNERKQWCLRSDDTVLKSPIDQVLKYKKNFYDLHIENLLQLKLKSYKYWYVVSCALYFDNTNESELENFLKDPFRDKKGFHKYNAFLQKNISLMGRDSLNGGRLRTILEENWISKESKYFSDTLYDSFKRRLKPSWHSLENTRTYQFDERQKQLIESRPVRQKVKGIAGSGKTLVLAHRAVNSHKRTGDKVLILTYNITLKNYIRDRVSGVPEKFKWDYFHILNYHLFIKGMLNNMGVSMDIPDDFDYWRSEEKSRFFETRYFSNIDLFERHRERLSSYRYAAVFIDEFQDYREAWARITKDYFLREDGEFVIFGDWGQDIYGRRSENFDVTPGIPGRWNELKEPHRQRNPLLKSLNVIYQREHFGDRYDIADSDAQLGLFGSDDNAESIRYSFSPTFDTDSVVKSIIDSIEKLEVNPNDVCVMAFSAQRLADIEKAYRMATHEQTTTMVETPQERHQARRECMNKVNSKGYKGIEHDERLRNCHHNLLHRIRRSKKLHFWMNSGVVKFSTVHSFKGWEIHTLFLIVEGDFLEHDRIELAYTGLTRCMNNLIVFNIGDQAIESFFRSVNDEIEVEHFEI
jgi:hypothetical protein